MNSATPRARAHTFARIRLISSKFRAAALCRAIHTCSRASCNYNICRFLIIFAQRPRVGHRVLYAARRNYRDVKRRLARIKVRKECAKNVRGYFSSHPSLHVGSVRKRIFVRSAASVKITLSSARYTGEGYRYRYILALAAANPNINLLLKQLKGDPWSQRFIRFAAKTEVMQSRRNAVSARCWDFSRSHHRSNSFVLFLFRRKITQRSSVKHVVSLYARLTKRVRRLSI